MVNTHYFTGVAAVELVVQILVIIIGTVTWRSMHVLIAPLILACYWHRLLLDNLVANEHIWVVVATSEAHVAHSRMPTAPNRSFSLVLLAR